MNPSLHSTRTQCIRSLAAAALACALAISPGLPAAADATESPPAIEDEGGLEARLASLQGRVCAASPGLCPHVEAFLTARQPCLPEGERFTVGHAHLIADDGSVQPVEYFALYAQRAGDVTLIRSHHVFSENAEEKQAAEDLVGSVAAGSVDTGNALYRYLETTGVDVPQLLAHPERRALVVRGEGPALYLRQAGALIYAAMPDAKVAWPGQTERAEGLVFAVLPAVASCR